MDETAEQARLEAANRDMFVAALAELGDAEVPTADEIIGAVNEIIPHTFELADRLHYDDAFCDELESVLAPFLFAAEDVDQTRAIDLDSDEEVRKIPHKDHQLRLDEPAWCAQVATRLRQLAKRAEKLLSEEAE